MSCRPRRLSASGTWSRSAGRSLRRVRRSSCSRKATSGRSRPACAPATTPLPLSLPDLLRARLLSPVERGNLVATVESMAADARTQAYERALSLAHEIQAGFLPERLPAPPTAGVLRHGVLRPARSRVGRLHYINADHNPPVLIRRSGSERGRQVLGSTGPALGLLPQAEYLVGQVFLRPGDVLFLYTDGVVDARSRTGERFGTAALPPAAVARLG